MVTVFQPVDNFYIRGVLTDTKADGYGVRLQFSAATTGTNSDYQTVARIAGEGTQKKFDWSNNSYTNLKGVFLQLCVDSDRDDDDECGSRFYINKP